MLGLHSDLQVLWALCGLQLLSSDSLYLSRESVLANELYNLKHTTCFPLKNLDLQMNVTDKMEQYVLFKEDLYAQLTLVQHQELKKKVLKYYKIV